MNLGELPDPLQRAALRWFERAGEIRELAEVCAALSPERRFALGRTVAFSEFAGNALLRDPEHLSQLVNGEGIAGAGEPPGIDEHAPIERAGAELRLWRRRAMTGIIWREVNGLAQVSQTLGALSAVADVAIRAAVRAAQCQLEATFGHPAAGNGRQAEFIVLGMGKLGGRELNFSSDVDLIFLYGEGGETSGPRRIDNEEYFNRLGAAVIGVLDANTDLGFVFRVDMRLRPFGKSGPLAVSLAALEDYLQQHGRDWERYAWIKARAITGAQAYATAYHDCVRPFVYRRYLDFGVFESLREMKALIVREVSLRDRDQHLKLGAGGIREIEFIVQSFQLVRAGSDPRLQNASILDVLPMLAGSKLLGDSAVADLTDAYLLLRGAENAVQMIRDEQTHMLPEDPLDRERVALALRAADWCAAKARIDAARAAVARQFEALIFGAPTSVRARAEEGAAWFASDAPRIAHELKEIGFPEAQILPSAAVLETYRSSGAYRRLDETGRRRIGRILNRLLHRTAGAANAAPVLERVLRVIEAIGARSSYLALLNEQTAALERLIEVCGISGFLARQIAEFPLLLDELIDERQFDEPPSRERFMGELKVRMERVPADDAEREVEALRQFQKAAIFAVALADLTGRLPIMKVSDRLTDIAELIVQRCVDLAWQQTTASCGVPHCAEGDAAPRPVKIAVVGYGKLGGLELGYSSDLDLVFIHDSRGDKQQTLGDRPIENGLFFVRLVQRIVHLLTMHSSAGRLYDVDMRLRPNGKGGFLITGLDAFERYQHHEAWTWEHQALLRARAVAGDIDLCGEFERARRRILTHSIHRDKLRAEVAEMRARMRAELSKAKSGEFDIKQDAGGIADIEFLVQYWALANAGSHPNLVNFSDNIRQLEALASEGLVDPATAHWLIDAYRNFRLLLHRLSLESQGERVVDAAAHARTRQRVQEIWHGVFGGPEP